MQHTMDVIPIHKCMDQKCLHEFVILYDDDFDYFGKELDKQYLSSECIFNYETRTKALDKG